jgi:hypothetical protein
LSPSYPKQPLVWARDSDPRRGVYLTLANQTQMMGGGAYANAAQADLIVHALPQLDIELMPQVTLDIGEYRYAWLSSTDPITSTYFGKLDAKNVSVTLRASYTFTPRLTLQAYGQAFLTSGHFTDVRMLSPAAGTVVHLSDLALAALSTPGINLK